MKQYMHAILRKQACTKQQIKTSLKSYVKLSSVSQLEECIFINSLNSCLD
jgi:hypothetical protein